jgi:hypothetical protein
MNKVDPWELLREAQPWIQVHAPIEATDLLMRINDALAERNAKKAKTKEFSDWCDKKIEEIECILVNEDE